MKVSELINLLQKCKQDADVEFTYASDKSIDGTPIEHVVQITLFGDETRETTCLVQLQAE